MRYLISIFILFFCLSAFSQVDRIELGYQTSKRGIEWTRPGLPTHVPVFRISRDTNAIIWHDKNTGIRYDWDYITSVWYARGRFSSSLPPLPTQTSGLATIDNRTAFWLNASNILHRYDITQTAWVPLKITYQSAAPTNVASGGGNGAAIYTTTLWQDSDDFLIRFWDGDSWELIGNVYDGSETIVTAGTGISVTGMGTLVDPYLITNTSPDQTVSITGAGINVVTGTYPNFTVTGTEVGTVSSVGLALPVSVFSVSGSPVTSSGTLTGAFTTQTANTVFAGPTTGSPATPAFRALVAADLPSGTNLWTDGGATTYLTATGDNVAIGGTSATQKLDVIGSIKGSADLYLGPAFKIYDNGSRVWHRSGSFKSLFVGDAVGTTTNTGNRNFGFGTNLFQFLTSGEQNVAIGGAVLYGVTTGSANVGIGVNVMQNLTTGNSNMSIGGSSGSAITTGLGNCLIGSGAGGAITTGSYNMAIGTNALRTLTTQGYNAAIGFQSLYTNSPSFSVAIGSESGYGGANRLNGLYLGAYAGYSATAATQIAIGYGAGYGNTIDQTLAIDYNPGFISDATPLISGNFSTDRVGINTAHASLAQTFNVTGTARITGSTGTATTVMGRDANGDISALSLSGMSISSGTLTATDGSTTNELQTIANTSDATSHTVTLSNSGGSVQLVEGSGVTLTTTGTGSDGVVTIAATGAGTDLTFSGASSPVTLNSSTGTDVTFTAGTGISLSASSSNTTITNSAPDQTVSITNGGGVSVSGTYPNFTLTATDASATNEAQTLSVSGTTSGILSLNAISGVGGGTATIAAGTGITVGQSGGTITITNSSPATAGWLLDGNTITAAKRIGSNDNFDVVVETNGTDRMWFDNAGTVSIGATQLTTAALNINGLQTGTGMLISGGGSLSNPFFYTATGSGTGSTATVFSGVISMLNGNVEALIKNTATSGTGGALLTLNTHQSATGDPKTYYTTNSTTDWTTGIDNSVSGDPFKITANSDLGGATPAVSATTANKVGINQAAAVVTLQVTGTDAIGLPTGTTAQRSAAAIPQIRHNNTFSGLEFYDQNKNYWYRLTAVSTPSATSNTAAGTGHSGSILAGSLSSDVRGTLELNTGSSPAVGTVMTVTYASAFSGTKTVVTLTPANDQAATDIAKWRIDTQSNTGFTIRAVSALTASSTYTFNYYVGQ